MKISKDNHIMNNLVRRAGCVLACLAVVMLLITPAAFADGQSRNADINGSKIIRTVDPIAEKDNYSAILYNNLNGLPTSEANDLAATSEGFIWIGSYSGLIRYDGNTFERMDATIGLGSVVSLLADSKDRLWIGTNESGLAMMEKGKYTFWNEDNGLTSASVTSLTEDGNGLVYAGTDSGIAVIYPDLTLKEIDDERLNNCYIDEIYSAEDGTIYAITSEDAYAILKDGELKVFANREETAIKGVRSLLPDPENPGMVYLGTDDSYIYYADDKPGTNAVDKINVEPLVGVIDIEQIGGRIWVCARNGIGVIDDDGFHLIENLPMDNSVTEVMDDYEGNMWFASTRQGVMKLTSNQFSDIFAHYGLKDTVVNSTCLMDNDLYIGSDTGLIVLDEKERIEAVPLTSAVTASGVDLGYTDLIEMLDGCRIRSIIRDSKNRLWISTWRSRGLVCYDHGAVTAYTTDDGLMSMQVRTVFETHDGSIAVANTGGVSIIKDGKVTISYSSEDGIKNTEILVLAESPNGDILAGSNGGGIYVINDNGVSVIGKKDGLTSGIILRVKYDRPRGIFWIITSNSIAYMNEDYKVTTIKNFPYNNNFDVYVNNDADMWVLSSNGIYVVHVDEMIADQEINPVHFSVGNGMPCTATVNSHNERTADGRLFISGSTGVAMININKPFEDVTELKQGVPFIKADDQYIYPDEDGKFHLPSTARKVTIYAYVFNYSLTNPKISYRLIGFDNKPISVSRADFDPVTYTNLTGGEYVFEMKLTDALGRNNNLVQVHIIKEKHVYETTAFYLAMGALISALFYILVKALVDRKMLALEEKHRDEQEKARISTELNTASRIQNAMLPHEFPPFPEKTEFDLYALTRPAKQVGGDFYDYFLIDDDHLCIIIADVSGKGIPAALYMMVSKALIKSFATQKETVSQILEKTNDTLSANEQVEMFVTVWIGILELSTGKIRAANAGHEYPVLKRADSSFELLKDKHSTVVGGFEGVKYTDYELDLKPGDKLFLYTDGVPEAANEAGDMFGTERLVDALNEIPDADPAKLIWRAHATVDEFSGTAEQFDDMTMLCLDYKGKE